MEQNLTKNVLLTYVHIGNTYKITFIIHINNYLKLSILSKYQTSANFILGNKTKLSPQNY